MNCVTSRVCIETAAYVVCIYFLSWQTPLITNTYRLSLHERTSARTIQGSVLIEESEFRGRIILIISMPIFLTTVVKVEGLCYSMG